MVQLALVRCQHTLSTGQIRLHPTHRGLAATEAPANNLPRLCSCIVRDIMVVNFQM